MEHPPGFGPGGVSRSGPRCTYPATVSRRALGWSLVVIQAVLLVVLVLAPHRAPTAASLVAGGALVAAGALLGLAAFRALGRALTPTPVPVAGAGLRTTGAYRLVRHPIYSAILLAAAGFTLAVGTGWTLLALGVLAAFFVAKSRWEDRLLREQYGHEWDSWARTTGALLPRPAALRRARG
jgi:protein-S-isoprenylcysteine O-methyltransferase Ste14